MISVRLYSNLRKYCCNSDVDVPIHVKFEPDITIAKLIVKLGIAETEVSLVAVNQEIKEQNCLVQDGDNVSLFGVIAGG